MIIKNNLSNAEYHDHEAISNSLITKILKSPAHAKAYLDGFKETTPAMAFGSAFHSCVLEPEKFNEDYAVFEGDKRKKEDKARFEEMVASGKTIITADDFNTITNMATAINDHDIARALLANGLPEQSVFWTDKITGMECKCRPDWWDNDTLVDLKTTDDASPSGFARSVATYGYHTQAAHYMAGTGASRFVFIAVEKKPPYAIGVYVLDDVALDEGWRKVVHAIGYWKACCEIGTYPSYQDEIVTLSLPRWAITGDQE